MWPLHGATLHNTIFFYDNFFYFFFANINTVQGDKLHEINNPSSEQQKMQPKSEIEKEEEPLVGCWHQQICTHTHNIHSSVGVNGFSFSHVFAVRAQQKRCCLLAQCIHVFVSQNNNIVIRNIIGVYPKKATEEVIQENVLNYYIVVIVAIIILFSQ